MFIQLVRSIVYLDFKTKLNYALTMKQKLTLILAFILVFVSVNTYAQEAKLTKEQILNMSIEELSELDLGVLMEAVETLGVTSVDELFALIMNKNVSSASKSEENSFVSPLSSTVITKDEMKTYGITSIEEAFRLIPGMIVTEKTNGVYDIQIRGLNNLPDNNMFLYTENARTLLMIDGRISQNYAMGAINFDMMSISIEDVERIEVVRGGSSALYGPNAVQGVINIITEKPTDSSELISGSIQMGSLNTVVGDVAFRKSLGSKLAIGLTANVQRRNRPTDELNIIPQAGLFMANNPDAITVGKELSQADFMTLVGTGVVSDASKGGLYDLEDVENLRQVYPSVDMAGNPTYTFYKCVEPETPVEMMFPDSRLARETMGVNGYVSFYPTDKIRLDLTSGYQNSFVNATPVGDDYFSFNGRASKTGYLNLNANVYGLSLNANYCGGMNDYAYGVPGFKAWVNNINISAEYNFVVGDLSIRPGIAYQRNYYDTYVPDYINPGTDDYSWTYHDPGTYTYDFSNPTPHLSSFFIYDAELTNIAPSLRLDYKLNDLRLIAAIRSDKTNAPDQWNASWQFAANYSINDNHFVRVVYSRANSSAQLVNSHSNFCWTRTDLHNPYKIQFSGNKNAAIMYVDNIELGYRLKPTQALLIDAELFYSMSTDYGCLQAEKSMMTMHESELWGVINEFKTQLGPGNSPELIAGAVRSKMASLMKSKSVIQYDAMPYNVRQGGIGINVDWIISPKLVAKVNANMQFTTIDNYYAYNQTQNISNQLNGVKQQIMTKIMGINLPEGRMALTEDLFDCAMRGGMEMMPVFMQAMIGYNAMSSYKAKIGWDNMTEDQQSAHLAKLRETGIAAVLGQENPNPELTDVEKPLGLYYGLAYNIEYDRETKEYYFGSSVNTTPELEDNHKHKATPSVYGMVGLIYKPINSLSISAFGNFVGKREYTTKYGTESLDNRFTVNMKVGYKPVENFELFFNAHNLFDTKDKEFVYCDEIGGIYTVGVNFGF
jgi:iron complex outermembrane receptor protein